MWNAVIQGAFDRSASGGNLWVGESGALTATALILFAILLYKAWPLAQPVSLRAQKKSVLPDPVVNR